MRLLRQIFYLSPSNQVIDKNTTAGGLGGLAIKAARRRGRGYQASVSSSAAFFAAPRDDTPPALPRDCRGATAAAPRGRRIPSEAVMSRDAAEASVSESRGAARACGAAGESQSRSGGSDGHTVSSCGCARSRGVVLVDG